jgi:hypothetical protein
MRMARRPKEGLRRRLRMMVVVVERAARMVAERVAGRAAERVAGRAAGRAEGRAEGRVAGARRTAGRAAVPRSR